MAVRAPVPAPPAQPPRYGLLVAAPPLDDADRWQGGVEWEPEQCGQGGREAIDCPGGAGVITPGTGPGLEVAEPFVVWAADECSSFGNAARDWQGRARRQLAAIESFEVANELWEGTLRDQEGWSVGALVDVTSDTVTEGPSPMGASMACLEQGLASALRGRRGMIHATVQALVHWVLIGVVRLEGGQYLSPMGNIVVADAGYTGAGPDSEDAGATQWAYATGMVQVRRGPVETVPDSLENARMQMDRQVNTIRITAQRLMMFQWDSCAHLAAELDLATCQIGGAS